MTDALDKDLFGEPVGTLGVEVGYVPSEYMGEVCPAPRKDPSDWIVEHEDKPALAAWASWGDEGAPQIERRRLTLGHFQRWAVRSSKMGVPFAEYDANARSRVSANPLLPGLADVDQGMAA